MHLFKTFSLHPLAGPMFHTAIQIALSFKHILLVYIPHVISFVSYQCLERVLLHFKKGAFTPLAPPNERQEGHLHPSAPFSFVLACNFCFEVL